MPHLLLLDAPGGNDLAILSDAIALGHQVTFMTGDLAHYRAQGPAIATELACASAVIDVHPYDYASLEAAAHERHAEIPFDAMLCLLDIRIADAARLARALGLRFLNPATARLARNKVALRAHLAAYGLPQPGFAEAHTEDELAEAVAGLGYPVLVKPADGFGSQNVRLLRGPTDLAACRAALRDTAATPAKYGLGAQASGGLAVERYIEGPLIGCDVFSNAEGRILLGINDKLMFPPPSFAMRGSCFPSQRHDTTAIRDYAFAILDAIGFDFGAAHIEMIIGADGPVLVEVNPRLVSAQIPYQIGYAFEGSIHHALIDLHLGHPLAGLPAIVPRCFSAIRWITADRPGILDTVFLPENQDPAVRRVTLFKQQGDAVRPPISNGDRIGYVIATGASQTVAEAKAERYIAQCQVALA